MRISKRFRLLILGIAVVSIFTLSIVFAVVSQTLTISTDVEIMPAALNVEFDGSVTESEAFGNAEVLEEGTIDGTNITGLSVKVAPDDSSYVISRFTAVNNSENIDVKLRNISLEQDEDDDSYHIKLMHYIDEGTTREIGLYQLDILEFTRALEYMLENFTSDELEDLGFGVINNGIENLAEEDLDEIQAKLESMKASFPILDLKFRNTTSTLANDYLYSFPGSGFGSDYAQTLYSVNNATSDEDSREDYEVIISAYQPTEDNNLELPEGYYLKYTDISIFFEYGQVTEESNPEEP